MTSIPVWILFYFTYRYGVRRGALKRADFYAAGALGLASETGLLSSLWWARKVTG